MMSYCKICGDREGVKYYPAKHNTLCPPCAAGTPGKVQRTTFYFCYFGHDWVDVPKSTRCSFYDDYLASTCTLDEYIEQTTEEV